MRTRGSGYDFAGISAGKKLQSLQSQKFGVFWTNELPPSQLCYRTTCSIIQSSNVASALGSNYLATAIGQTGADVDNV